MRWILGGLVLVLVSIVPPPSAVAVPAIFAIQPGAVVNTPVGQCTLNFVFKDASNTYIGTAGHCADVGQRVSTTGIGNFGTVVFDQAGTTDFALIRIDASQLAQVSPAVRTWGGPIGTATTATAKTGDLLLEYGYGIGFSATAQTRARAGVLLTNNGVEYIADTGAVNGDSGAPLVLEKNGQALGIISHYAIGIPPATDEGPTMEHILSRLQAAGFSVALQTAPFDGLPV